MVVFNCHGSEDAIFGNKGDVLIKQGVNDSLLKGRITYARSCHAASSLGFSCMENNKTGCFIGYTLPFEFYFNYEWAANPLKDNVARIFLEPSNLIPISLIKGNSTNEAHEKSKKQMLKNIKKVLRNKNLDSFSIAESLWNNYLGQTIIGNRRAKL